MVDMLQKKKNCYLSHSLNSMGPIVSMEMALAEASFKGSHIMEWVNSLNSFEKFTLWHSFIMIYWFKKINYSILNNILLKILFAGHPVRVFILNFILGNLNVFMLMAGIVKWF